MWNCWMIHTVEFWHLRMMSGMFGQKQQKLLAHWQTATEAPQVPKKEHLFYVPEVIQWNNMSNLKTLNLNLRSLFAAGSLFCGCEYNKGQKLWILSLKCLNHQHQNYSRAQQRDQTSNQSHEEQSETKRTRSPAADGPDLNPQRNWKMLKQPIWKTVQKRTGAYTSL